MSTRCSRCQERIASYRQTKFTNSTIVVGPRHARQAYRHAGVQGAQSIVTHRRWGWNAGCADGTRDQTRVVALALGGGSRPRQHEQRAVALRAPWSIGVLAVAVLPPGAVCSEVRPEGRAGCYDGRHVRPFGSQAACDVNFNKGGSAGQVRVAHPWASNSLGPGRCPRIAAAWSCRWKGGRSPSCSWLAARLGHERPSRHDSGLR